MALVEEFNVKLFLALYDGECCLWPLPLPGSGVVEKRVNEAGKQMLVN